MKRFFSYIFAIIMIFFLLYGPSAVMALEGIGVSADTAILIDAKTGQVLYAKKPFKQRPPASTTKIMTALLAIEMGKLNDKVTVSAEASATEGSSIYLKAGEVISLNDLLYGALMKSGNDACEAIAEHIAGTVEDFAVLMNMKALALGALNTHFVNPHGLPDPNHYTCAFDLAVIARKALANQTFYEIVSTKKKTIDYPGHDWDRTLKNTNRLLWSYQWADGVKTGTTNAAGPCLIASASKGNRKLITVVLNSGDRWSDSIRMLEYGFNRFSYQQVAVSGTKFGQYKVQDGTAEYMPVVYAADLGILLPTKDPGALEKRFVVESYPVAPVRKGQVIGSARYFVNGVFAGKVDLISGAEIKRHNPLSRLLKWLNLKLTRMKEFAGLSRI